MALPGSGRDTRIDLAAEENPLLHVTGHNERTPLAPEGPSVTRAVAQFALTGLIVLALFLVGSLLVFRSFGRDEALRDARQFAVLSGQGIVEPAIRAGVLEGEPGSMAALDRVVNERVLGERVVRVKIWDLTGRVVYSDEPRLVGSRSPLDEAKLDVVQTGATRAELSDLDGPENRFERGQGDLYEVYLPIRAPDGTPLLFETYQRASEVASTGRRIWLPFAGLLLASLVLLWLVQVPLAWRLANSLRRSQQEREALLIRTLEASTDERRRIAADLHDGVVQDLAGISYSLSATAETTDPRVPSALRETLRHSAAATREAMRRIRSLLVEIHPPNLQASGLEAALRDLVSPLVSGGVQVELEVPEALELPDETERLIYRAAGEAIRNVERHARANRVSVRVTDDGARAGLEIVDDGVGFTPELRAERRQAGHVGLSLLDEVAVRSGGRLAVTASPGEGTSFVLEVPVG